MDEPDYNKMSKKELIDYIKKMINQKAFTYEDRMKLAIIDNAPFTIWANDRDCKIRFWSGKCEKVYGYNTDYTEGKDFVDLFVSKDEKLKARIDCRDIIDNGKPFNNIANDETFDKIPITLQTNCFRIRDVDSNEILSAEIGVLTNSIEEETKKTENAKGQSQQIESILNVISNLRVEINNQKKSANSNELRTLNKLEKRLTSLCSENKKQEKECNNWDDYMMFIGHVETELNDIKNKFNSIIGKKVVYSTKNNNNSGIPDHQANKI